MACLTWQKQGDERPSILHARDARPRFEAWIHDPKIVLAGHFIAYDMAVAGAAWPDLIPAIFAAYEDGRVICTMLREMLWDIAIGAYRGFADEKGVWRKHDYNLEAVARRRAGIVMKKDGWRRRYGNFIDVPLEGWVAKATELRAEIASLLALGYTTPDTDEMKDMRAIVEGSPEEVIIYPLNDATATLAVVLSQEETRKRCDPDPFVDEHYRARDSWWENLMSTHGLRTRAEGVEQLRIQTERDIDLLTGQLVAAGLVRPDKLKRNGEIKEGSRDTKAAIARMLEVMGWRQLVAKNADGKKQYSYEKLRPDARALRKTKANDVSLDKDACKASDDPLLVDYGERAVLKAVLDKDIPMLQAGTLMPVHSRIGLAASGRTTSSGPNVRNLRRLPGIREAFVPREGMVYAQADYPGVELRTLAQTCFDLFGYSTLGDMLNRGEDPHLAFAAQVVGMTYAEAKAAYKNSSHPRHHEVVDARQVGKVFNFGSPGGLGAEKLVLFARKTYNTVISVEDARRYKKQWLSTLPEMRDFFRYVGNLCDNPRGEATIMQLRSNRIRGGCTYTAGCNTFFQGLGADATQDAGFHISKGCYVDRASALFGSRIANYVYDEFILETRDDDHAHNVAHELARMMQVHANVWLPNVPFLDGQIEPLLMRVWSKDAEPLHHFATKRLVPWEPALASMMKLGQAVNEWAKRDPSLARAA